MHRYTLTFLMTCILTCIFTLPATGETYLVNPDGSGDFATIRQAVNASLNGDVIQLGDGEFTGLLNKDVIVENRAITIQSVSGDPAACVINCGGSATYNHCAFYVTGVIYGECVIEGITFTGGYMTRGGAITIDDEASAIIRNCLFESNAADEGGAISLVDGGSLTVNDCDFILNSSNSNGGAIFALHDGAVAVTTDCSGVKVTGAGNGMIGTRATLTVENCRFDENTAAYSISGGSAIYGNGFEFSVSGSEFTNHYGTAIYLRQCSALLTGCQFKASSYAALST